MPRYVAQIANLLVQGEERTTYSDGSFQRSKTRFVLGGFNFALFRTRQSFSMPVRDLKGEFCHTHDLVIDDLDPTELKKVERLVEEITELLSFATQSQVVKFGQFFQNASSRQSVRGVALFFRPAFTQGDEIRRFLEQTWRAYHRLRRRRKLHVVIDYLSTAEKGQPLEVQLLIASAVLESLKSTYAAGAGYKYHRPHWRRISKPPKPNIANEPMVGFENMLREMLRKVRMRPRLRRRNDIVHNGTSRRPALSQYASYELAQGLVREYLLRLLG